MTEGEPGVESRRYMSRPSDHRPFLTLVEREYLHSMGNISNEAWEPMSYLYSEVDAAMARIRALPVKEQHERLREITLEKWGRVLQWLDQLLINSGSVRALRSWQMVQSFQAQNPDPSRPAGSVIVDVPRPPGPDKERKGLGLRR